VWVGTVFHINIHASLEQDIDDLDLAPNRGKHERRVSFGVLCVDVSSCLEQAIDGLKIAITCGSQQGGPAKTIGGVDVGAGSKHPIHHLHMAAAGGT
jgi:hypothetical protein